MPKLLRIVALGLLGASFLCGMSVAYANVELGFSPNLGDDYCSTLPNSNWTGTGDVSGILSCSYTGTGNITGDPSNLSVNMHLSKSGGSFLCPSDLSETLTATCSNNGLVVRNSSVNLKGTITDPNKINMSGEVNYDGITANLSVGLNRQ